MEPSQSFSTQNGILTIIRSAAASLLLGDVVYITSTGAVNKSLTPATNAPIMGVVVGGTATYMKILQDVIDIGIVAAATGDDVLVATDGVVKCIADGILATIGTRLAPGETTAGRVQAAGTGDYLVGIQLEASAAAGDIIDVLLQIGRTNVVSA